MGKKYCKKSCDLCTVKHCDDSKKYSFKCPTWANFGECHKRPNFMKKYCKKSCNLCTVKPTTPTTTSTTKATGIECKDKLDTCHAWKKEGECTKVESQTFMTKYCKKLVTSVMMSVKIQKNLLQNALFGKNRVSVTKRNLK